MNPEWMNCPEAFDTEYEEWCELVDSTMPLDEGMDGDHESALASAGFGTDEDYGYYGGDEW